MNRKQTANDGKNTYKVPQLLFLTRDGCQVVSLFHGKNHQE